MHAVSFSCNFYLQVLSDSDKRRTYDQHGEEGVKKMGGFEDGGGFDPFSS